MTAEELMNPRFMVSRVYPNCKYNVGEVLELVKNSTSKIFHTDQFPSVGDFMTIHELEKYPHLFRKINWWEHRTKEEMPRKVKSLADDKGDIFEIEEWDMENLIGWISKKERKVASLLTFRPEYGYIPID